MAKSGGAEALDRGGGWVGLFLPAAPEPPAPSCRRPTPPAPPARPQPAHWPGTPKRRVREGEGGRGGTCGADPRRAAGRLGTHRPCPSRSGLPRAPPRPVCEAPRRPRFPCEAPVPQRAPTLGHAPFQMLNTWPPSPASLSKLVHRGSKRPRPPPRQQSSALRRRKLQPQREIRLEAEAAGQGGGTQGRVRGN